MLFAFLCISLHFCAFLCSCMLYVCKFDTPYYAYLTFLSLCMPFQAFLYISVHFLAFPCFSTCMPLCCTHLCACICISMHLYAFIPDFMLFTFLSISMLSAFPCISIHFRDPWGGWVWSSILSPRRPQ